MMRLGERIINGEPIRSIHPGFGKVDLAAMIKESARVIADEPAGWYWKSETDSPIDASELGPVRSPFDLMWVEYNLPSQVFADGEWKNRSCDAVGCLIEYSDNQMVIMYVLSYNGSLIGHPACDILTLNPDSGKMLPHPDGWQISYENRFRELYNLAVRDLGLEDGPAEDDLTGDLMLPCCFALSLMHCKNVDVSPTGRSEIRRVKKKRREYLSYGTIKLPMSVKQSETRGGGISLVRASAQPIHLVRGHFKTFTEDAPLFGSHTGTYWWGWQARGDAKFGVNVNTYEVETG